MTTIRNIAERIVTVIAAIAVTASAAMAQESGFSVHGTVTDSNGEPLIGVAVMQTGQAGGALTDLDGNYSITVTEEDAVLTFSYLGFETETIAVNSRSEISLRMRPSAQALDESVVVAYGSQKRINVTGAISQVSNNELKTAPSGNLSSALAGKLPGLVTRQTSGQPGADGSSMYIRGIGAGDGQMLVVVDGIIRPFPQLNPDEIESITILKDATAAAAYGVRASAGVMIVTTKRGNVQKPTVTFNSSVTLSTNANFPEFLDGAQYAYWYNKAEEMDGVPVENRRFSPEQIDRITNGDPNGIYANTDWFDLLFRDVAPTYTNNISLSGGSEKFRYFVSLGAYNQQGIIPRTSFDRYNVRVNLDANITKDFSISAGIAARESIQKEPGLSAGVGNTYASIFQQTLLMYPYLPQYYDGLPVGSMNGAGNGNQNPIAARDLSGETSNKSTVIETNMTLKYDLPFLKGLSVKLTGSYDKTFSMKKIEQRAYKLNVFNQSTETYSEAWARHSTSGTAQVNQWYTSEAEYMIQPSIEYKGKFGDHSLNVLFLYEYSRTNNESLSAGMRDYIITDIMDINYGQEIIPEMIKGGHGMDRRAGYVGRINYNFREKYLFEFTIRYDGTPYLPKEYRWGVFPGASFGWRISEEPFFKNNVHFIDNLKIRMSAGRLGSDRSLNYNYSYLSTMSMGSDPVVMIGNTPSYYISPSAPPNQNLRWQTNDTYNLGIESSMWHGMLGIEFDAFYMHTKNKLEAQSSTFPPSMGNWFPTYINYGEHSNKGIELVLSHQNRINDFFYSIRGNVSWARNKILKMTEDPNQPAYMRQTGQPMGQYYGFVATGLFQTQEEVDNSPTYGPTLPGDIKLQDLNHDGRITWEQDRTAIGRSSTPEMMFGLNINGEWRGFDFNIFFQGAALADIPLCGSYTDKSGIYDDTFYTRPFAFDGNSPVYLLEGSWTPENTDAKYPRLGIESRSNGGKMSSWWIVDGSYLRLKSVQIGYSLPSRILSKAGIEKLRFYISGGNLVTWSALPYLDPEMPDVNQGYYPQQRTFEFGLNFIF